jgi:hypothetical protein
MTKAYVGLEGRKFTIEVQSLKLSLMPISTLLFSRCCANMAFNFQSHPKSVGMIHDFGLT